MNEDDLCYASIETISGQLHRGALSSVELTEFMLARIERLDGKLNSYAAVMADTARSAARRADEEQAKGMCRSALHGVPVAVKDLLLTRDAPTEGGMPLRRGMRSDHDATVVKRLRDAGAVLLGKQTMTEGATFYHHSDMARPVNPVREDLWPGVSSSGSAVSTAAGLCFASLASDTGGSIRFPSACTGTTGLKTSWGRVSRYGALENAPTWDTLGTIARSAADAAIMFDIIGGYDPRDPEAMPGSSPNSYASLRGITGLRQLKIGIDRSYLSETYTEVATLTDDAAKTMLSLEAELCDITLPDAAPLFAYIDDLQSAELAATHSDIYPSQAEKYGPQLRKGLDKGRAADPVRLAKGLVERSRFRGRFARLFDHIDLLLMPVFTCGTPTWDEADAMLECGSERAMHFTGFVSAAGNPSLTLPCGRTSDGRPVGFQLIAADGDEELALRAGHAFQLATDWHTQRLLP